MYLFLSDERLVRFKMIVSTENYKHKDLSFDRKCSNDITHKIELLEESDRWLLSGQELLKLDNYLRQKEICEYINFAKDKGLKVSVVRPLEEVIPIMLITALLLILINLINFIDNNLLVVIQIYESYSAFLFILSTLSLEMSKEPYKNSENTKMKPKQE